MTRNESGDAAPTRRHAVSVRAWGKANQVCEWLIRLLDNTPVFRLVALAGTIVGFIVIVGTAWQIWNDFIDRREDRIDRAWNRLLRPLSGNTGKADAFEYLTRSGLSLSGVNLSCGAVGNFDLNSGRCAVAPVFQDLDIGSPDGETIEHGSINFSGAVFNKLTITNASLTQVDFDGAKITGFVAENSLLDTTGSASITECSFAGSAVQKLLFDDESYCDFSNTLFLGINFYPWPRGYAWADSPPFIVVEAKGPTIMRAATGRPLTEGIGELGIRLCAVPLNDKGEPLPLNEREFPCEDVSVEQARELYPERYTEFRVTSLGKPDSRWSPWLLGKVQMTMSAVGRP